MPATTGLWCGMAALGALMAGGATAGSLLDLPPWLEDVGTALVVGFIAATLLAEVAPTLATSSGGLSTGLMVGSVFVVIWFIDWVAARLSHGGPVGFAVAIAINFLCDGMLLYIMARGSAASAPKFALVTLLLALDNVIMITLLAARNRDVMKHDGSKWHLATVIVPALIFFAAPLALHLWWSRKTAPAVVGAAAGQEKTLQAAAAGALAYALVGELAPSVTPATTPIVGLSLGLGFAMLRTMQ